LARLVQQQLGLDFEAEEAVWIANGQSLTGTAGEPNRSLLIPHETGLGRILIRLIDWSVDGAGVVDAGNPNRGRITANWKIAPFFEDVKLNEFGY
jgi:hypothetical protein